MNNLENRKDEDNFNINEFIRISQFENAIENIRNANHETSNIYRFAIKRKYYYFWEV